MISNPFYIFRIDLTKTLTIINPFEHMTKKITLLALLGIAFMHFTTAQTILSEGFEGATFPPSGWTSFIGTNGLGTNNNWIQADAPYTGTYGAANVYENVTGGIAEDWLVTSQIDLTTATNAELRFYSTQSYTANYGSTYEVKVSTTSQTNHADFTTVANYTEVNIGNGFELKTVDLSAYDGMMVYIAFVHYNDDGDNWLIDDIEVRSPLDLDAKLNSVSLDRYGITSTDNQLSADVFNNGMNTITALNLSWSDGTNSYSEDFSVNIAPGATQTVNHSTQVNYGSVVAKDITVTINTVNSVADGDSANNSRDTKFNTMTQAGTKAVFIEEATGTWCGWCPRGTVGLDYITSTYPSTVVAVAVHNGDPMALPAYDTGLNAITGGGFPNSAVDRKIVADPGQASLQAVYDEQINEIVPVNLSSGSVQSGSTLTINAQASFYTLFDDADFRLGVIISEDGVTGTSTGYAQVNYYSGGANGPMGGYESLPGTVPAAQMVYNHVGRALLGGFDGQAGSIPAVINAGDTFNWEFTYTIPSTSNVANMHIVVVLIDATDGSIVSAQQSSVAESLSVEEVSGISTIKIYPNPAKDNINIAFQDGNGDYTVSVTDMLGRTVIKENFEGVFGIQNKTLPISQLNEGHYIMNINDGTASYSTKFVVSK